MTDLDELERKARAATPGRWSTEPHGGVTALYSGREPDRHGLRLLNLDDGDSLFEANAVFIAAANPAVILALIERVRAAEAAKAGLVDNIVRFVACGGIVAAKDLWSIGAAINEAFAEAAP